MPQAVYSKRLFSAVGFTPQSVVVYITPIGYTAVLRDIDLYNSAGSSNSEIYIEGDKGQTIFHAEVVALTKDSPQWRGRQVFYEGETISVNLPGPDIWDITMSGYELVNA